MVIASMIGLPLGVLAAKNLTQLAGRAAVRDDHPQRASQRFGADLGDLLRVRGRAGAVSRRAGAGHQFRRHIRTALCRGDRKCRSEAARGIAATGASQIQTIVFAILPQALPQFVSYNLYWFEVGVRSATVLGMVGAGGIGFELITAIRLYRLPPGFGDSAGHSGTGHGDRSGVGAVARQYSKVKATMNINVNTANQVIDPVPVKKSPIVSLGQGLQDLCEGNLVALPDVELRCRPWRIRRHSRAERRRQIDASALHQPASRADRRPDLPDGIGRSPTLAAACARRAGKSAWCFSSSIW